MVIMQDLVYKARLQSSIILYPMHSQKLITSISTIPNESKLYFPQTTLNYSLTDLKLPMNATLPLKFPKKYIRKQTNMTMLAQTNQNPEKSTIRNFNHANRSRVFQQTCTTKRIAREGLFQSLSRETNPVLPLNRSLEDFGAPANRKRFVEARHLRPNPIVVGHPDTQHNSALQRVWGEPRRHRDNGKICQQTLNWKTNKTKGYLERYKEKKAPTYSTKQLPTKYSILS